MRAWLDSVDMELARALEVKTGYGQKVFADAANVSMRSAETVLQRGRMLTDLPRLEAGGEGGRRVWCTCRRAASCDAPGARRSAERAVLAERIDELAVLGGVRCPRTSSRSG